MTSNSMIFYIVWAVLAGVGIPVLASLNGTLGRSLQSPTHASLISVAMAFGGVLLVLLVLRPPAPAAGAWGAAPVGAYFGGLAMGFYALTAAWLAPRLGVGNLVISVVCAQLATSAVIDQFGLFGAPVHAIDLKRAAGLVLLAAGAALVALK